MTNNDFNYFHYPPTLSILRKLVEPASLIDNLLTVSKAIRFYFILKQLYAKNPSFDSQEFTFNQLRDFIFNGYEEYHDKRDLSPNHIAVNCLCNQSPSQLLFGQEIDDNEGKKWQHNFLNFYACLKPIQYLEVYLSNLEQEKPFHVTGKKISQDLDELVKRGWLRRVPHSCPKIYQKHHQIPLLKEEEQLSGPIKSLPISNDYEDPYLFVPDDFASFTHLFSQPINGVQRFYLHADYQTPSFLRSKINKLQKQLKKIWAMNPVPPLEISYTSASLNNEKKSCLIYPTCLYYYQRWFYLCAFGQTPRNDINWYNYRLDRIEQIETLSWDDSRISNEMYHKCYSQSQKEDDDFDPLILDIQSQLEEAYGLDFYQQSKQMLLRFPPNFHNSYIENTLRHHSFKKVSHQQALNYLKKSASYPNQPQLIQRIENCQQDSFYCLSYRDGDNYVIMRLRAWSPNVEVLLPKDLRQRVAEDLIQSLQYYQLDT
ncbi:MAG: TIGR03985 family CRISPR-associated protein [Crocosphaera sp.]